jgi:hypothetical protein
MESSESKDELLQIHVTTDKLFYYAGDLVRGIIHVNCLADHLYRFLAFLL